VAFAPSYRKNGRESKTDHLYVADGEGFRLNVRVRNREYLEKQPVPYVADLARG
jgi:hypothetical protein